MKVDIHACFFSKTGVIQAVESLLRQGVSEEDITLILPGPKEGEAPCVLASQHVCAHTVAAPMHTHSAVACAGEEGIGLGFGLGLLTAMCIPGIGLIAASATIITALVAAGAIIGGIAGGVYGYLVELEIPHEVATAMASHISSGGATLSVSAGDTALVETVIKTVAAAGGTVIASTK